MSSLGGPAWPGEYNGRTQGQGGSVHRGQAQIPPYNNKHSNDLIQ